MVRSRGRADTDRLIAAALQVNGRASWGLVARVLDLPERTVARRGQRLLDEGRVRISTYLDVSRFAGARGLLVRVHSDPSSVHSAAHSLAHRPDASSVSILEGDGDIECLLLPTGAGAIDRLLREELAALPGVGSFEVSTVLRTHRSGYDWNAGRLPAETVSLLTAGVWQRDEQRAGTDVVQPEAIDERLISLLARDGRASVAWLAAEAGTSVQTVRRRLEGLFGQGVLHVRTEVDPAIFDLGVEALVWLRAPATELDRLGRTLADHDSVRFCAAATGTSPLLIDVLERDVTALYDFQQEVLGALPGVEIAESRMVVSAVRRGPLLVPVDH